MTQFILAQLHHMAQNELEEMLPPGTIDRLKAAGDEHPMIKVYSIGHEGTAHPSMVTPQGKVKIAMQYLRDAVNLIGQRVKEGVAAFKDHAATNLHAGRKAVGQVVAKTVKEIDGKLHALTAIHIFPEHRDDDLDIASFEANAKFGTDKENNAKLWDLEDITGIALGSTKEGKAPAFPGATLRGAFQHFADSTTIIPKGENETMITVQSVKDAIAQGTISVDQILGSNDLLEHPTVKAAIETAKTNQREQYETMRRLSDSANSRVDEMSKQLAEKDGQIAKANASVLKERQGVEFKKIATQRKLDEKQNQFCQLRLKDFTSEAKDDAELQKNLNEHTDKMLQEYEEEAKIFGVTQENGDKGAGTPPGSGSQNGGDLTTKDGNDFIP